MGIIEDVPEGVIIAVKVVPGASRNRVAGPLADAVKIQVSAPAEKGRANEMAVRLLGEVLGLRSGEVSLISGPRNPRKRFLARGICADEVKHRLGI